MIHQFPIVRNIPSFATLGIGLLLVSASFALPLLAQNALADLNGPVTLPPSVENISNLQVVRGKSLQIKLEASTASPSRIEFVVGKDDLKHGTLTDPVTPDPQRKHIASVTYTPALEGPDVVDTFTYMVKQPGREGAVLSSTTATVTIRVLAAYPELVASEVIDYGEVYVGSAVERTLTLSNTGGAPFQQVLEIPDGFTATSGLPQNKLLELAPQSTKRIRLAFYPTAAGRVQHKIVYQGHKGQATQTLLYATGIAPFHCAPSQLKLEWKPEEVSRMAKLEVTSSMEKSISVAVSAPQALGLPTSILLGPGKVAAFDINIPAKTFKESILGDIRMTFEKFSLTVPVLADGVPAYLQPVGGQSRSRTIDFPEGSLSDPVVLTFVNGGTNDGRLFADLHHEFVMEGIEEGQVLGPGEQLSVTIKPAHNIHANGPFVIKCGTQRLEYTVTSEKAKIDNSGAGRNAKVEITEATSLLATEAGAIGGHDGPLVSHLAKLTHMPGTELSVDTFALRIEGTYKFDHTLPRVDYTEFIDGGRRFLEFSWAPLTPDNYSYHLHVENIHLNDETGAVVHLWAAKDADIKKQDGRYVARLENLNPGMAYNIRIIGVTPDGRASMSESFRFLTAVPRPLRYVIGTWTVTLLCLTSATILIYRRIKARRFYQRYY